MASRELSARFIWIGEGGFCEEARTLTGPVSSPSHLSRWNHHSGITLCPQAVFKDPFGEIGSILVMCDGYASDGKPIPTNKRYAASMIFKHPDVVDQDLWIVIQQEYTLWSPAARSPASQAEYYPDAGVVNDIVKEHYNACSSAGINISGNNGKIPDKCKFQVGKWGSTAGISAVDELCVTEFILEKIAEERGMLVSFEPEAILQNTSNEADTHIWFSTLPMRKVGGFEVSEFNVLKLKMKQAADDLESIRTLGPVLRAFPIYETSTGASGAKKVLRGYFINDRRPAANMDPYEVISKLVETAILWKPTFWEILLARLAMIPFPGWVKRIFRRFFY